MRTLQLLFFFLLAAASGNGQLKIKGVACVARGTEYEYSISGLTGKAKLINICIKGGQISGTKNTCTGDTTMSQIRVTWNEDSTTNAGTISVTTGSLTELLAVDFVASLSGGTINSDVSIQEIDSATVPAALLCSGAMEGSCNPAYTYQWESSPDNIHWTTIDGQSSQQLVFKERIKQSSYYRRKTVEGKSASVAYSNVAVVFIKVKF